MNIEIKTKKLTKKLQKMMGDNKPKACLLLIRQQKAIVQKNPDIQKAKAICLGQTGEYQDSLNVLEVLNTQHPNSPDILNNLSIMSKYCDKLADAIEYSKLAVKFDSVNVDYFVTLASLYKLNNERLNAIVTLKRAGLMAPNNYNVLYDLAVLLNEQSDSVEALEHLSKIEKNYKTLLIELDCYVKLNQYDSALKLVPLLINTIDKSDINSICFFIQKLQNLGEFDCANKILSSIPPSTSPQHLIAMLNSGALTKLQLVEIEMLIENSELNDKDLQNIYFSLADQLFNNGDDKKAFKYLHAANGYNLISDDTKEEIAQAFNLIKDKFAENNISDFEGSKSSMPIFIVGMPRSGTTLLETVLASHSNVFGAGETPYIKRSLNGVGKGKGEAGHLSVLDYLQYIDSWDQDKFTKVANNYLLALKKHSNKEDKIVDKMPHNFLHLGIISKLFPKAKIIHISRNPIACCLSIYKQNFKSFHTYASDLNYLAIYYKVTVHFEA